MSVILYTNQEHMHRVSVLDRRYRARSVLGFNIMLEFDQAEIEYGPNTPSQHYDKYRIACERVLGPRFFDIRTGTTKHGSGQWMTVSKRGSGHLRNEWKFCIFLRSEKVLTLLNLGMTP